MMASDFIIEVTEADFEYQVIAYSHNAPVVVDFWAEWCIPCRTLGPLLEKIALEANGSFRLAKVDVDANQNLSNRYNIRSIPAVKAFRDGNVFSEFVGVQPEPRLREFLSNIAPGRAELALEKGNSLIIQEQWKSAEAVFRQALGETPDYPPAMLGLAKCLLVLGQTAEAQTILRSFPASREYSHAQTLRILADAVQRYKEGPGFSDDPLEAAYLNALRLTLRGNLPAAMDGMLDILRQDKRYRNGEVRQVLLALLEVQGEANPLNRQYRQEMASVLF
jgi:putative thioredoxin